MWIRSGTRTNCASMESSAVPPILSVPRPRRRAGTAGSACDVGRSCDRGWGCLCRRMVDVLVLARGRSHPGAGRSPARAWPVHASCGHHCAVLCMRRGFALDPPGLAVVRRNPGSRDTFRRDQSVTGGAGSWCIFHRCAALRSQAAADSAAKSVRRN
jgi:hypothetical protein